MRRIPDQSIFALGGILAATFPLLSSDTHLDGEHPKDPDGFMATSPRDFHLSGSIRPVPLDEFSRRCGNVSNLPLIGFTSSPYGICVEFPMIPFCECIEPNYIARLPHSRGRLPHLWLVLLACEHAAHPGCLLARACMLIGPQSAPDLCCASSVRVVKKRTGSLAHAYTMLPWSPSRAAQLNPRPTLHVQPIYIRHLDTSDWESRPHVQTHDAGWPRAFPTNLNMTLAPWAADALRGEGFGVHLCRWMSPVNYPIHRLVLSRPGYAASELVFYLSTRRQRGFLRFIASSMDEGGGGFGFGDNVDQSVTVLDASRNRRLNYDIDGPDIFLSTMAGDEVMVRLTVEEPERPLEGGFTHYLFVELMRTRRTRRRRRRSRRRDSASEMYQIDFGSV